MSRGMMTKKKNGNLGIDRLSTLPEELVIHILSFLDTKSAIQASASLKKWVNLWTLIPGLHFDIIVFKNVSSFDKFVRKVLTLRNDSEIIKFNYSRGQMEVPKSKLKRVFKFIASHQVQHLTFDASILVRPRFLEQLSNFNSVSSLKLQACSISCSLCLEQVVTLHLEQCRFIQPENFSGCTSLKNLRLVGCMFKSDVINCYNLSINSPQLSSFTISSCSVSNICDHNLMLSTPRLAYFAIRGFSVPLLDADDLTFLDTVAVVLDMSYFSNGRKVDLFSPMISSLKCFRNVKSVRLSYDVVKLLSLFPDALEREPAPFCNLKSLNIVPHGGRETVSVTIPRRVMTYLRGKSPHANTNAEFLGAGYYLLKI